MAYERITWVPRVLRKAGLKVVEHDGWKTRGLSTSSSFEPRYIVWHHDASAKGDSPGVPAYMIRNYNVAGAQLWVDRAGVWHIIASGRAAHAGATRNSVTNNNSIGIETDHTTGEAWPEAQLESLRLGTAAMLEHLKRTAHAGLHFHKSICYPVGRKVDPDGLDLDVERVRVARVVDQRAKAKLPAVKLKRVKKAAKRAGWARKFPGVALRKDVRRVKRALKAEGVESYRDWQRKLGLKGAEADGIPRKATLTTLGDRHGFRVVT